MDYLIKKSDSSIIEIFPGGAVKIKLPEMTGTDAIHVGDKRPMELGDYLLIKATVIDEPIGTDQKRGPTDTIVDVDAQTVSITHTAVNLTAQELWDRDIAATDKDMPRWLEEHIESAHSGVAGNVFQQIAYDNKKVIRGQKP